MTEDADRRRDLVLPAPCTPDTPAPRGLTLGVDMEELYFDVGEAFNRLMRALDRTWTRDADDPKVARVRAALWTLPNASELVQRLDDILNRSRWEDVGLERDFDRLMDDLRQALSDDDCPWYEVGVFLARFFLCVEIVDRPPTRLPADYAGLYRRELARVVPSLRFLLTMLPSLPTWSEASLGLRGRISSLDRHLDEWDGGSPAWCHTARERAGAVFTAIGMTYGQNLLTVLDEALAAPAAPAPARPDHGNAADAILSRLDELTATMQAGDPLSAEAGIRELLVMTRRTTGPRHRLVHMIQMRLCVALLNLGAATLATALAYDTADETRLHLGPQHPITVMAEVNVHFFLLVTGNEAEAAKIRSTRLAWLLSADPEKLSPELKKPRESLSRILEEYEEQRS
ncbi:hypothetical protein [Salinispora arenicola]|uniref:hypothetical protein n=1 Tax=Salinispora arenicola TaxID=168697 RepID=UPI00037748C0|nr:hypothetical protein [Salinispora arenicola]